MLSPAAPLSVSLLASFLIAVPYAAQALEFGAPFSDHMVLQRGVPVPIWGTAEPGEAIRIRFRSQIVQTQADAKGRWRVDLEPLQPGEPEVLRVRGSKRIRVKDVLVGEVWIGAGELHMAIPVGRARVKDYDLKRDLTHAPFPQIRLLKSEPGAEWSIATPAVAWEFSGLLFSFGVKLQKELDVPVGLIMAASMNTPLTTWMPKDVFERDKKIRAAIRAGAKAQTSTVGVEFEKRILPLAPMAVRSVLWDQGFSGTGVVGLTPVMGMDAVVRGWRAAWGRKDLPFLYMQKPSGGGCAFDPRNVVTAAGLECRFMYPAKRPGGPLRGQWIEIAELPDVSMVPTADLGTGPKHRDESGYARRALAVARVLFYGGKEEVYGPTYKGHQVDGASVRVSYDHVGEGLVLRGKVTRGFELAGADRVFHWADAKIAGEGVVLRADAVPEPRYVRYAWAAVRPWANLFNKNGLPAQAFSSETAE